MNHKERIKRMHENMHKVEKAYERHSEMFAELQSEYIGIDLKTPVVHVSAYGYENGSDKVMAFCRRYPQANWIKKFDGYSTVIRGEIDGVQIRFDVKFPDDRSEKPLFAEQEVA